MVTFPRSDRAGCRYHYHRRPAEARGGVVAGATLPRFEGLTNWGKAMIEYMMIEYMMIEYMMIEYILYRCYGASDEEMARSSLQQTDGVPPCDSRMT